MSLKSIINDYKNKNQIKKKEINNKIELEKLKKNPIEKIGIKSILQEYKTQIEAKGFLSKELIKNKIDSESLMDKIIIPAFEDLRIEFEKYGEERKSNINTKPSQSSLIVFCNGKQEFIYRISIKNDNNNFKINAITYHINPEGEISLGKDERIFSEKRLYQISENDFKNDFYTKYRIYLLSNV